MYLVIFRFYENDEPYQFLLVTADKFADVIQCLVDRKDLLPEGYNNFIVHDLTNVYTVTA